MFQCRMHIMQNTSRPSDHRPDFDCETFLNETVDFVEFTPAEIAVTIGWAMHRPIRPDMIEMEQGKYALFADFELKEYGRVQSYTAIFEPIDSKQELPKVTET